jgi:hypothetical protein
MFEFLKLRGELIRLGSNVNRMLEKRFGKVPRQIYAYPSAQDHLSRFGVGYDNEKVYQEKLQNIQKEMFSKS